jgi:hypothetical protein
LLLTTTFTNCSPAIAVLFIITLVLVILITLLLLLLHHELLSMGIDDLGIATLRLGSYTNTMGDSASLKQAGVGIHRRFYHIERL